MTMRGAVLATTLGLNGRQDTDDNVTDNAEGPTEARTGPPLTTQWRARVTAIRNPGAEPWSPSDDALERARRAGAALRHHRDGYELTFSVTAPDLARATRAAMSTWARLYERCALPDWQLTATTVANVDAAGHPAGPAEHKPRHRQRRRLRPAAKTIARDRTPAATTVVAENGSR